MDPREAVRIALRSIRSHKLRSTLTVVGLVIGIASVIVFATFGASVKTEVINDIEGSSANNVYAFATPEDDEGFDQVIQPVFTERDVSELESIPGVTNVIPRGTVDANSLTYGNDTVARQRVTATTPETFDEGSIVDGRGFRESGVDVDGEAVRGDDDGGNGERGRDDPPVERQEEQRGRQRPEGDAEVAADPVVAERGPAAVDRLGDQRQPRGVVDARGDAPHGDREPERGEGRGDAHEEERRRHPPETGEDERLGAEAVDEDAARERADPEQPVADRGDESERGRGRRELRDPHRQQDRDRELVGVDEPVRAGGEGHDPSLGGIHYAGVRGVAA